MDGTLFLKWKKKYYRFKKETLLSFNKMHEKYKNLKTLLIIFAKESYIFYYFFMFFLHYFKDIGLIKVCMLYPLRYT